MKILIVNNNMEIGGIQKSLANLLSEISTKHDVTLFLFNPEGALMDEIPENVQVINGNFYTRVLGMSQNQAKKKGFICAIWRSVCVILSRIFGTKWVYSMLCAMQKVKGEFDAAVSFMQNSAYKTFYGGCNEFVLNSVKANKKIAFIHCDFEKYPGNNPYNVTLYERFDTIACVSDSTREIFERVCPKTTKKTATVYNMYAFSAMEKAAEKTADIKDDGVITLFTSARISPEKGILRIIPILRRIKEKGGNFRWYIAGDGPDYEKAVALSEELNLSSDIVFLGMLDNPYPYFKNSDIVLVPSYNEAAPMVYGEAIYFKTPVFTTETTSAKELVGTEYGWVVQNNDVEIEKELTDLMLNPEKIREKDIAVSLSNEKACMQFENILR